MVGAPILKQLKMMLRNKIIQNLPVTVEYIEIEEKIFSPDVCTLKGRKFLQRKKVVLLKYQEN